MNIFTSNTFSIMGFTPSFSVLKSFLSYCILCIVFASSNKKMIWISAFWVITLVAYTHSYRNQTKVNNPTYSMSFNGLISILSNRSISSFVLGTNPSPTPILDNDLFPKSLFYSWSKSLRNPKLGSMFILHVKSVLMCHAPGYANIAGAFSQLHSSMEVSSA